MADHYELIIVPMASEIPQDVRLRKILKALKRVYEFRCKSIKRIDAEEKKNVDHAVHRKSKKSTA